MLNFANFVAISRNPSCSVLLFFRTRSSSHRGFVLRSYNQFFISHFMASSSSSSSKIVVEYARSSRSSCKKCRGTIAFSNLRLGLVSRDPRGYDATRWHHLHCFPVDSQPIGSAEEINGFPLLKGSDQEALKNLVASCRQLQAEDIGGKDGAETSDKDARKDLKVRKADESGVEEFEGSRSKKPKVRKADESGVEEIERSSSKKPKEAELEIAFSSADIKNKYKDATLMPKWKALQTIIFLERDEGLHDSSKIAAFDFDGCLVKTSVKRIGPDAWSLLYPSIPGKLKSLYDDGYKLVIFTNESNIERWKNKRQVAVDSKIGRLNSFIELANVPIQVFIACGLGKSGGQPEDLFRKPKIGMWRIMEQQFNSGIAIDMDKSFYVGDAAGRPNDHSDADVKFAQAIGLKFYVPEDFFTA